LTGVAHEDQVARRREAGATGERLVQEAFPGATILRPSVIVGPEGGMLNRLAALARVLPVLPLFGRGGTKLQPVYVGDVAAAAARALATPAAAGKLYELGGPRVDTYEALVRLVLEQTNRRRWLLPVPFVAWEILAVALAFLPNRPVSRDQVKLMRRDNVVTAHALTLADLGVAPTAIETLLPPYPDEGPGR
jgi:uncharacterized protein YbjT (DUF2867 family)